MRIRANDALVYFYKKGNNTDSVLSKHNNLFYLVCKESEKSNVLLQIENARFLALTNDSLIQLEYLPGLKYEAWYTAAQDSTDTYSTKYSSPRYLKSLLNGTSETGRDKIRIQIYSRKDNSLILENQFNYKD